MKMEEGRSNPRRQQTQALKVDGEATDWIDRESAETASEKWLIDCKRESKVRLLVTKARMAKCLVN